MTRMAGKGRAPAHHAPSGGGGGTELQEAYEAGRRDTMSEVQGQWEKAVSEQNHQFSAKIEQARAQAYEEGKQTMEKVVEEREAQAKRLAQEELRTATLAVEERGQAAFRTRVDEVAAQKYFAPRTNVACTAEREMCVECYRETGDGTRQYALHCADVVASFAACAAAEKARLVGASASKV